jgi:hypothetical protein
MLNWIKNLVERYRKWRERRAFNRIVAKYNKIPFVERMLAYKPKTEILEALNRLDEECDQVSRGLHGLPPHLKEIQQELKKEVENRGADRRDDFSDFKCRA